MLLSLLCTLLPFSMMCTLILLLYALIVNLLSMMRILVPIMIFFDACYAKLNVLTETMNKQHECFVGKIRECVVLPPPRLKVHLCDDYVSSFPLKPNFMVNSPLTTLEEVLDPPFPSSPLVASYYLAHLGTLLRVS